MVDKNYVDNMREFPIIFIGDACRDFYKNYDGPIVSVTNDKELQDTIGYYSSIPVLGRPLVIEDIAFIEGSNAILLKFLEETKLDVVLLSRFDKVDPVLASRVKKIEKYSREKTTCHYMTQESGYQWFEQQDNDNFYMRVKHQGQSCPMLMMLDKKIKSSAVKKKYYKLIGGNLDE